MSAPRDAEPSTSRMMKVPDVADELGWSIRSVRYHVRRGNIPMYKLPNGREWVISRHAFLQWKLSNRYPPFDEGGTATWS